MLLSLPRLGLLGGGQAGGQNFEPVVRVLAEEKQRPAGVYRALWDGGQERGGRAPRGVYFCRFASGGVEATRKLILLD